MTADVTHTLARVRRPQFRPLGYLGAEPLAVGIEGAVYRVRDGLVDKVWASRPTDELVRLQHFYRDLAAQKTAALSLSRAAG